MILGGHYDIFSKTQKKNSQIQQTTVFVGRFRNSGSYYGLCKLRGILLPDMSQSLKQMGV